MIKRRKKFISHPTAQLMKKCQGIHKKEEKEDYGDWFGGLERTDRNYRNYQIFLISIVRTHG